MAAHRGGIAKSSGFVIGFVITVARGPLEKRKISKGQESGRRGKGRRRLILTLHGGFIYRVVYVFRSKLMSNGSATAGLWAHCNKCRACSLVLALCQKMHAQPLESPASQKIGPPCLEFSADSENRGLVVVAHRLLSVTLAGTEARCISLHCLKLV